MDSQFVKVLAYGGLFLSDMNIKDISDIKGLESSSSTTKRPGVNLMRFGTINFFAFFLASFAGSLALNFIGLTLSLVLVGVLVLVLHIFIARILLKSLLKQGSLKLIGKSKLGVSVYEIDDQTANALAVGFWKYFGYIIVSTGLIGLLNELEFSEIINHEDNHIRQMHNLTLMMPWMLSLIVVLSVVQIALNTPIILVFAYVAIMSIGLILSLTLSRNIETLADSTSDPAALSSALMKMEEHNRTLRKVKNRATGSRWRLFSTHPRSSERPKKPSKIKHVSVAGIYVSFLVIIGVAIRIIIYSEFNSFLLVFTISLIITVTILGSGFVVIEYLFIYNLMGALSKRFGVKSFDSINALNGTIAFFIVSAIPTITGMTNLVIMYVFVFSSIVVAVIVTALGTKPFKKGILASVLAWFVNSGIIIIASLLLIQINLLGA